MGERNGSQDVGRWEGPAPLMRVEEFEARLAEFREFARRNLREGVDYGVVPGTGKPTLLKPGAEKMLRWQGLGVTIHILPWSKTDLAGPVLDYDAEGVVTHLATGVVLGNVHANANSEERRWRNARQPDPGRPDKAPQTLADQKNTILKMLDKRIWVAAALLFTGASEAYTQDLEDAGEEGTAGQAPEAPVCPVHKTPFRWIPPGTSPRTGKPYAGFWACSHRGCKAKPPQGAPEPQSGDGPETEAKATPNEAGRQAEGGAPRRGDLLMAYEAECQRLGVGRDRLYLEWAETAPGEKVGPGVTSLSDDQLERLLAWAAKREA